MREAVLVLGGLGATHNRREKARRFYAGLGYEVFVPNYITRASLMGCVENVAALTGQLRPFDRLHVFCNIFGGWVFNLMLRQTALPNLHSVIYDRSPAQEQAARRILDLIPFSRFFTRFVFQMILDFEAMPYPPLPDDITARIGLMIENKPTRLMRVVKRLTPNFPALSYGPESFNQAYNDLIYVWLDHDEIYSRYDVTGADIAHFFRNGLFTADARRVPF
jgi:hypothetical protein